MTINNERYPDFKKNFKTQRNRNFKILPYLDSIPEIRCRSSGPIIPGNVYKSTIIGVTPPEIQKDDNLAEIKDYRSVCVDGMRIRTQESSTLEDYYSASLTEEFSCKY